ncbi:MAG: anti-sigma-I factor RsgI family protein [Peptococcia bacterium]
MGKLEKVLNEEVRTALHKQNIEAQVELLEVSAEIQQEAKKQGLSAGKYAIMLEAKEAGLEINVEDMKFSSVVQAIKEAGGIPGQIISRAKQDQQRLSEIEKELRKLGKISDDRAEKGNSAKDTEKQDHDRQDYGRDRERDHNDQDIDKNSDKNFGEKIREKYSEKFKEIFFKEKVKDNSNKNNKDKYIKDNKQRDEEDKEDKEKESKDNRDKKNMEQDKQKEEKRLEKDHQKNARGNSTGSDD